MFDFLENIFGSDVLHNDDNNHFTSFASKDKNASEPQLKSIMSFMLPWMDGGTGKHFFVQEASDGIDSTNIGDHTAPYMVGYDGCDSKFKRPFIHPYIKFKKEVESAEIKSQPWNNYSRVHQDNSIEKLKSMFKNPGKGVLDYMQNEVGKPENNWSITIKKDPNCKRKPCDFSLFGPLNAGLKAKKSGKFSPFCLDPIIPNPLDDFFWNARKIGLDAEKEHPHMGKEIEFWKRGNPVFWYDIDIKGLWADHTPLREHMRIAIDAHYPTPNFTVDLK